MLMCRPALDHAIPDAQRQWDRFVELLRIAGDVEIELIDPVHTAPDLVFTANAALVNGDLAILSTHRDPAQLRRRQIFRSTLAQLGLATTVLQQAHFEGAADVLFDRVRPIVYAGYGLRSDRAAALQLSELIDARIVPLRLVDERFSHLDMALCPLGGGHVMAYMPAFEAQSQRMLRRLIEPEYLIELGAGDALDLACNAVEVDRALVLAAAGPRLRTRLMAAGYRVFVSDLPAFVQAGAGTKKLTLRLGDAPAAAGVAA
jgi:N-dimethylarginine dimethylaminohydrolase